MINKLELIKLYRRYGFKQESPPEDNILVFSLMAGHYHNVDIIPLEAGANTDNVFDEYKSSGYACKVRNYRSVEHAEAALFKGFFSSESTHSKFEKEYNKFAHSIAKLYSESGTYEYIKSEYTVNDSSGEATVVEEVVSRLDKEHPILFLIEAAAGFGKTCTAYEILNEIVAKNKKYVPLFTELSRNRQAKIFRYVLLDEIDRSFPTLSSGVVNSEIRNGNVPVLLDGFDELLHESNVDNGYENTEPMLETIGELLVSKAKIILTTRRTAIFDGDEFHQWMEDHGKDFSVVRIRIFEPTVAQWLPKNRIDELTKNGLNVTQLSNPVLLSYLRFIDDDLFHSVSQRPEAIVQKYFESMLERERTRQDLRMPPEQQYSILLSIARDMVQNNYTGESREYLVTLIQEYNLKELENIRIDYPAEERPTTDEIANKLASHALLDRSSDETQGIGFINDFVLGNFSAEVIMEHPANEWVGDKRFIEPAILSYAPRTKLERIKLWNSLKFTIEFAAGQDKILTSSKLTDSLNLPLHNETVEGAKIQSIVIGKRYEVKNTIFIDCKFTDVDFYLVNMNEVTFMNCDFFDCSVNDYTTEHSIHVRSCQTNNDFLLTEINHEKTQEIANSNLDLLAEEEKYILERFWPKGRPAFIKHKAIKALLQKNNEFNYQALLSAITSLKAKGWLIIPTKKSFLELNVNEISKIKQGLGKEL